MKIKGGGKEMKLGVVRNVHHIGEDSEQALGSVKN
jgi:hypothetical protein